MGISELRRFAIVSVFTVDPLIGLLEHMKEKTEILAFLFLLFCISDCITVLFVLFLTLSGK